jgi:hypothetical protein
MENSDLKKTQVDVLIQDMPDGIEQSQNTELNPRTV